MSLESRLSICQNDNNVRCVATVTCCWRQQGLSNIFKCKVRVGKTVRCSEVSDGCLKWFDWRVVVQINFGFKVCGKGDKTHACVSSVNIQSADEMWQKQFHQMTVFCGNTCWLVHHENDVLRTVHYDSCNRVVRKKMFSLKKYLVSVYWHNLKLQKLQNPNVLLSNITFL